MFTTIIDVLTVIVMIIVLSVLILQLVPTYRAAFNIFSANIYGF
ncbi:MAG: hypothetical protein U9Q96_01645 [Patescibacteria group bacterium]|nr:hypothetical protein [Patescibacteria group bacterium]